MAKDLSALIIEGILLTLVSSIGLIGNTLSIIVLTRSIKNSSANPSHPSPHGQKTFSVLLRALATFDALFLLSALMAFGIPNMSEWFTDHVFMPTMAAIYGFMHTFRVGSVYVTLSVTYERFLSVVCPLKIFPYKKKLVSGIVLFSSFYNIPKFFENQTKLDTISGKLVIESTALRQNPLYITLYVFWSKLILVELIPYISIVIMNVAIIVKLYRSNHYRRTFYQRNDSQVAPENNNQVTCQQQNVGDEKSLSLILITMSCLFVFCQSIKIIPDMYELFECRANNLFGHFCNMGGPVINGIVRTSHLLVCFNSSANFLIYYFFGTKFRRAFVVTYSPIWTYIKNKITRNKPPIIEEDCGFQVTAEVPENIELAHFNFKDFRSKYGPTLV